jgi:hypothetical protein
METVTLQGPIVILPAEEYQQLHDRLTHLETTVIRLTQRFEDLEDITLMREAEAEYFAGDTMDFASLLAEVQTETN